MHPPTTTRALSAFLSRPAFRVMEGIVRQLGLPRPPQPSLREQVRTPLPPSPDAGLDPREEPRSRQDAGAHQVRLLPRAVTPSVPRAETVSPPPGAPPSGPALRAESSARAPSRPSSRSEPPSLTSDASRLPGESGPAWKPGRAEPGPRVVRLLTRAEPEPTSAPTAPPPVTIPVRAEEAPFGASPLSHATPEDPALLSARVTQRLSPALEGGPAASAARTTFNVNVHLEPSAPPGGMSRQELEDALVDILLEAARRHGLEL